MAQHGGSGAAGRVIVLNGTSSSGKSTLIRALQAQLDGPWVAIGIDTVVFALPSAYLDQPRWSEVFRYVPTAPGSAAPFRIETGELGERLIRGLHRMVRAMADAGVDVIVDHVLLERAWLDDLAAALDAVPVLFVGVTCPLDVVLERERARKDRTIGQAAAQFEVVHRAGGYDVEVDTARLDPDAAAGAIVRRLADGFPARAFAAVTPAVGQPRVPDVVNPAAGSGS